MQRLLEEDQQEVEVTTPATTRKSVHSEELKAEHEGSLISSTLV